MRCRLRRGPAAYHAALDGTCYANGDPARLAGAVAHLQTTTAEFARVLLQSGARPDAVRGALRGDVVRVCAIARCPTDREAELQRVLAQVLHAVLDAE